MAPTQVNLHAYLHAWAVTLQRRALSTTYLPYRDHLGVPVGTNVQVQKPNGRIEFLFWIGSEMPTAPGLDPCQFVSRLLVLT
jgi:hypothetical protein